MKEITTLEELKEAAITINRTFRVVSYETNKEETLEPNDESLLRHLEKGYRSKRGMIAFVTENTMYVIPYMSRVIKILVENGFEQKLHEVKKFWKQLSKLITLKKKTWLYHLPMVKKFTIRDMRTSGEKFVVQYDSLSLSEQRIQLICWIFCVSK